MGIFRELKPKIKPPVKSSIINIKIITKGIKSKPVRSLDKRIVLLL